MKTLTLHIIQFLCMAISLMICVLGGNVMAVIAWINAMLVLGQVVIIEKYLKDKEDEK